MKNKIKTMTKEKSTNPSPRKMTTVNPLRGFKDMPYGHTTCGVTLLNLSRQKKKGSTPQGKGTTNKAFLFRYILIKKLHK